MLKPSKIICVGLNYKKHAQELNMSIPDEPIIFLKPTTTLIYDGDDIIYPEMSRHVDYEAELGLVISKQCKNISIEEAKDSIKGYVCANDVTARDLQRKDGQWTRAKSFDTFCPISKEITPIDTFDPLNASIKAFLNGNIVQDSNTSDMIFTVYELVSFISKVMTLFPDDLILTGTPQGVGPMQREDTITIEIEGIGKITNTVM
ncbi:MAG: fumarylacetoacetate hydrolase family protein [bacterium]